MGARRVQVDGRGDAVAGAAGGRPRRAAHRTAALTLVALLALTLLAVGAGAASAHSYYLSLSFVDRQHGYVTGIDNHSLSFAVWKTSNGGRTWSKAGSRVLAGTPDAFVTFTERTVGVWGVPAGARYTADGAGSWHDVSGAGGWLRDVSFIAADQGWGATTFGSSWAGGTIVTTTDGGKTWTKKFDKPGDDGVGGFSSVSCPIYDEAYALWTGPKDGVITSTTFESVVYGTEDNGKTWGHGTLPAISGQFKAYNDISFSRSECGWAVGADGAIAVTNDGSTWTRQTSGTSVTLNAVQFLDGDTGYAVGDDGVVLKTTNGGFKWVRLKVKTKEQLETLSFVDYTHGWVAGSGGVLLRTSNGGKSWQKAD